MKKSRFSEEQVVAILREADRSPVAEVAKKHKLSEIPQVLARSLTECLSLLGCVNPS